MKISLSFPNPAIICKAAAADLIRGSKENLIESSGSRAADSHGDGFWEVAMMGLVLHHKLLVSSRFLSRNHLRDASTSLRKVAHRAPVASRSPKEFLQGVPNNLWI
jgi:hypothetical protein